MPATTYQPAFDHLTDRSERLKLMVEGDMLDAISALESALATEDDGDLSPYIKLAKLQCEVILRIKRGDL